MRGPPSGREGSGPGVKEHGSAGLLGVHDLTGATLGSYELKELVGRGAMAFVYRAVQRPLGREVALKVLSPTLVEQPGFAQRFEHEAQTLSRLDCPNILPVFDYSTVGGITFLVMPYVRGGNLRSRLDNGCLERDEMGRVLSEIGEALHYAHEAGIVHRDVKPSNILIHPDGRFLLADFGLARNDTAPAIFTGHGFTLGTPGYMAPEQAMGRRLDRRADVYSLGVLAYEMLTGSLPYRGGSPMEVMVATVRDPIPSAAAANPSLPQSLDIVLRRVLDKDPESRYPTTRDFLTALAGISLAADWKPVRADSAVAPVAVTEVLTPVPAPPPREAEVAEPAAARPGPAKRAAARLRAGLGRFAGQVADAGQALAVVVLVLAGVVLAWRQVLNGSEVAVILAAAAGFLAGARLGRPARQSAQPGLQAAPAEPSPEPSSWVTAPGQSLRTVSRPFSAVRPVPDTVLAETGRADGFDRPLGESRGAFRPPLSAPGGRRPLT